MKKYNGRHTCLCPESFRGRQVLLKGGLGLVLVLALGIALLQINRNTDTATLSAAELSSWQDALWKQAAKYMETKDAKLKKKIVGQYKSYEGRSWKGLETAYKNVGRPSQKTGLTQKSVKLSADKSGPSYFIGVPAGYDPAKSWPLLIALHGGGSAMPAQGGQKQNVGDAKDIMQLFNPIGTGEGCIVVAPQCTFAQNSGADAWNNPIEEQAVFSIIKDVKKEYNIDANRIYLCGHSMGGWGAFYLGGRNTDFFAGVGPMSGTYCQMAFVNFLHTPIYIIYGDQDPRAQSDLPKTRGAAQKLKEYGCDYVYAELKGHGHGWGEPVWVNETKTMVKWLVQHGKRNMYPKKVVYLNPAVSYSNEGFGGRTVKGYSFWVKISDDSQGSCQITAEVKGNTIDVTTAGWVNKLYIYVSDNLVNMEKPITVVVDGMKYFDNKVDRSIDFLLEHLAETQDEGCVFANQIEINRREPPPPELDPKTGKPKPVKPGTPPPRPPQPNPPPADGQFPPQIGGRPQPPPGQ